MLKFQEILEDLILEKKMSLRNLEKESGVLAMSFSKYLKGSIPSIDISVKLANYFNCSLDYLFGVSESRESNFSSSYDLEVFIPRYEKALKENKTSHWKFCKATGLNESTLRHWKYGEKPSMNSLVIIATNLSTSIDYLVGRNQLNKDRP